MSGRWWRSEFASLGMALSRINNCLKSLMGPLGAVLLTVGLGWAALYFFFGSDVRRVDPAVLSELRTVGRVVAEEAVMVHIEAVAARQ